MASLRCHLNSVLLHVHPITEIDHLSHPSDDADTQLAFASREYNEKSLPLRKFSGRRRPALSVTFYDWNLDPKGMFVSPVLHHDSGDLELYVGRA